MQYNSKQDILNAFREMRRLNGYASIWKYHPMGVARDIDKWLLTTLTEFEREIYKEVDKKIWEVIDSNMKHVSDGIYDWKEDPKHVFFADNLKNSLKNITFELEKEKRT